MLNPTSIRTFSCSWLFAACQQARQFGFISKQDTALASHKNDEAAEIIDAVKDRNPLFISSHFQTFQPSRSLLGMIPSTLAYVKEERSKILSGKDGIFSLKPTVMGTSRELSSNGICTAGLSCSHLCLDYLVERNYCPGIPQAPCKRLLLGGC